MSQPQQIQTFKWDIVFAIYAEDLNKAVAAGGNYPKSLAHGTPGTGSWVKAAVDSWRIVPGGDSAHLLFQLALSNVTFGGLGVPPGAGLPALNVDIKTALRFQRRDTSNPAHQLKVAPPPDDGSGARAITATLDQTALQLGVVPRKTLQNAINAWLADHTADFAHVFAEIDVMDKAATGDFAWLAATSVDYAYSCDANAASLDRAVVGVMAMTSGHPDDLNEALVSQNVIPDGARAGCLISSGLYLEQALLPRLPGLFPGSSAANFAFVADKNRIELVSPVNLPSKKGDDGTDCPASLAAFHMDVMGAEICLYTKTTVLVRRGEIIANTMGVNKGPAKVIHAVRNVCFAVCEETSYFTLAPGAVVNGQQEIAFQADTKRTASKTWTEPPQDDNDASKTAGDVTRYTLMAMAFVSAFANPFLVACYGLALAGLQVASSVGQWNDLHGKTKAPPLDLGHLRQAMTFRWNGGQGYELTSVALNNGLWFGGVLKNLK